MTVKVTVNLPETMLADLKKMAQEKGITTTAALRQAIENQRYLHDAIQQGSKILVEKADRKIRELIIR